MAASAIPSVREAASGAGDEGLNGVASREAFEDTSYFNTGVFECRTAAAYRRSRDDELPQGDVLIPFSPTISCTSCSFMGNSFASGNSGASRPKRGRCLPRFMPGFTEG